MSLLSTGSFLGAVIGCAHAVYVFNIVNSTRSPGTAVYFAVWTAVLWILFGFYVVGLLAISLVAYIVFKAFR